MALFSVEIADADVPKVLEALGKRYGYQENISNPDFDGTKPAGDNNPETISNPQPLTAFANGVVRKFLSDNVRANEIQKAKAAAMAAVNADITISDPQV